MTGAIPIAQTTQTTVTTATTVPKAVVVPAVAPVANIIQKDALVTNVVDKAVLGNIIEKQNVEVVHKPVVQEIHEQRIIELERQNIIKNVTQDTVVQRQTDATLYEEIGTRDLEAERLRLASLNVMAEPVITRQEGGLKEVRHDEVVAQVVRQEHIERHVQPVITEIREQNLVKEVVQPIVRKVHDETIIREVTGTTMAAPIMAEPIRAAPLNVIGTTQGINANNDLFLGWERNMYNAYERDGSNWNRERWLLANPQPMGYRPTGFFNQYPMFNQYHTNTLGGNDMYLNWERSMYGAYERDGSNWNRERWLLANPQPMGYRPTGFFNQYPMFNQYHSTTPLVGATPLVSAPLVQTTTYTTTGNNDMFLNWERSMYNAYERDGSNWNRERWLLANPQPMGYRPTGFFNQYPMFNQYHSTTPLVGATPMVGAYPNNSFLGWERSMYGAYERDGSNWNRDRWLLANPQPLGYQPTGFFNEYPMFSQYHSTPLLHHTNVVEGGKLPKKPTDLSDYDGLINPVAVINPSENLNHMPTDGTVVPTTTLGEAPAHTHEVLKGVAVGAAVGSVVPVVGTVVGGVIGAIGGAIVKHKHVKEGTHAFKE